VRALVRCRELSRNTCKNQNSKIITIKNPYALIVKRICDSLEIQKTVEGISISSNSEFAYLCDRSEEAILLIKDILPNDFKRIVENIDYITFSPLWYKKSSHWVRQNFCVIDPTVDGRELCTIRISQKVKS